MTFAIVPLVGSEWRCEGLSLSDAQTLSVRFANEDGGRLEVTVLAGPVSGPVLRRLERCAVRYSERLVDRSPRARAEAASIVSGVAEALDARLTESGAATLAEALGRDPSPRRVTFSRDALRALIAPSVPDGGDLFGWRLHDVYPTSHARGAMGARLELVIDFRRITDGRAMHVIVGPRDDARPSFATTPHFAVRYMTLGAADPNEGLFVRWLVALALQIADHDALEIEFPPAFADLVLPVLASDAAPADRDARDPHANPHADPHANPHANPHADPHADPHANPRALNLAIDAPCAQSCAFCSVQERSPAYDGGDATLARHLVDLRAARARGATLLRLNGYDPLAFSRVLDVLREARALGYAHVDLFSPFTRLADADFADAVFDALPPSAFFHVPLYAADAALHDRIVGRAGAFDLVMRAIDRIVAARGAHAIHVVTVVVRDNVEAIVPLARFSAERGFHFESHLPHPTYEGATDRFHESAPRQRDVVRAIRPLYDGASLGPAPVGGLAPCVLLRVLGEAGIGPQAWLHGKTALPGTEYEDDAVVHGAGERSASAYVAATIACPHASRCALAETCGGRLLRAYVERHGADEFAPVSVRAIVDTTLASR